MLPVLSREVVEGKQRVAILDQALDSPVVFDAPGFDEGVERGECILLGLGHPDLLERALGLRLLALGQLVQDIGGLVHPTALAACPRELGSHRKPPPFEVEEELFPQLRVAPISRSIDTRLTIAALKSAIRE